MTVSGESRENPSKAGLPDPFPPQKPPKRVRIDDLVCFKTVLSRIQVSSLINPLKFYPQRENAFTSTHKMGRNTTFVIF